MRGVSFNNNWKFIKEDVRDGHLNNIDESAWKSVTVPHDWSVGESLDQEIGDGCTGYAVGGIGWYRKSFETTDSMIDGIVNLCFDGIYNRSEIYINGEFVDFYPYGYVPILVDVTPYLKPLGEENIVSVRVDHTRLADSRWYSGSGIYRKVSLHVMPKVNIPVWGTYLTTPMISSQAANVKLDIEVANYSENSEEVILESQVFDPNGKKVLTVDRDLKLSGLTSNGVTQKFTIVNPILWEILKSKHYKVITKVIVNKKIIQEVETEFGIRFFEFDSDKGFFFNGKSELIKGVCLHHDAGLVGSAVPKAVWRRRLNILIEGGCNAIRTAHNPASEDFLDLCDELGLLVQEEFYDEWDNPKDKRFNMNDKQVDYITRGHSEFFRDYAKEDLQTVMLRDRNHPSIIQWSIGNEIEWTYGKYNEATGYFSADANGNYFWSKPPFQVDEIREIVSKIRLEKYEVGDTAMKLATWTRELDTTRPIIANCILPSASYESGYVDALDMVGFSYRQVMYDHCHKHYPDKAIMGAENVGQWHEWKQVLDKDYISGIFLWTGIDYMGEAGNSDVWPTKGTRSGLLDLAGFKKPSYYMFKSLWTNEASLYLASQTLEKSLYKLDGDKLVEKDGEHWDQRLWVWQDVNEYWNYEEDELVVIEGYSNCDEVSLFCNDILISTLYLQDFEDRIYKWVLPYSDGVIKAVGKYSDIVSSYIIETCSLPAAVKLTFVSSNEDSDDNQVTHIEAILVDENGVRVRNQERTVQFNLDQDLELLGVDNGSCNNVQDYQTNKVMTNNGKCLLIVKGQGNIEAKVTASIID